MTLSLLGWPLAAQGRWRLGHISIWAAADHRLFADVYGPVHNVQTAEIFLSQPAVDKVRDVDRVREGVLTKKSLAQVALRAVA